MANAKRFGYIRVSSKDQNENRQMDKMLAVGIDERDIFIDKQSGKDFDRPQYQMLKRSLRESDVVYFHSLDRMGRNKQMILDEWREITKDIKADIIILDMPLLDTTQYKDSVGQFITDLVLQILSWIAEEEREKIKTRQAEGIESAKKRGDHLGRPKKEIDEDFIEVYDKWKKGELTAVEAFKELGMGKTTFYKMVKEHKGNNS